MELTVRSALLLSTIVAAGINSGSFFAFSNFVMPALTRVAPDEGARAMQAINRAAPNPGFMATLMGGAIAGVALAATASGAPGAWWQAVGGGLSAATAVITIVFHVPRNNALDRIDADTATGQAAWSRYQVSWTRGNHIRTATASLSVACLVVAVAA